MAKKKGNKAAIALLNKWLADKSGYDEKVWGHIRDFLNEGSPDAEYIALVKRALAVANSATTYSSQMVSIIFEKVFDAMLADKVRGPFSGE